MTKTRFAEQHAAEILHCPVRRPIPLVFRSVAVVWVRQREILCRPPNLRLRTFGLALGLELAQVDQIIHEANYYVAQSRRAEVGGQTIGSRQSRQTRWVVGNKIVTVTG